MATYTHSADWKRAPTHHVEAAGARFAYRRLGPDAGVPVVLLNHWGANLDNFDPPSSRVWRPIARSMRSTIAALADRAAQHRSASPRWRTTRSLQSVRWD